MSKRRTQREKQYLVCCVQKKEGMKQDKGWRLLTLKQTNGKEECDTYTTAQQKAVPPVFFFLVRHTGGVCQVN